jgi:hypothetical protein
MLNLRSFMSHNGVRYNFCEIAIPEVKLIFCPLIYFSLWSTMYASFLFHLNEVSIKRCMGLHIIIIFSFVFRMKNSRDSR